MSKVLDLCAFIEELDYRYLTQIELDMYEAMEIEFQNEYFEDEQE